MPNWKSLENVTALALGLAGLAFGDPGVTASGIVGGAGLLAGWRAAKSKSGMQSTKLLDKVRADVRRHYQGWTAGRDVDEADLNAADLLMEQDLLSCMPDTQSLAAVVTELESYPRAAAKLVVDRLARLHPLFGRESQRDGSATARSFALMTVETALRSALADRDYVLALLPHMVAALGQELARLSAKAAAILDEIAGTNEELRKLLEQVPDLALRREIMLLVGSDPQAGVTEIAGDVARFARQYRALVVEIGKAKADDNLLRSAEQGAEQALLDGDLPRARQLLDEAVAAALDRARAPALDLARVLDRQARAALLQRDWGVADQAWATAAHMLRNFDESAARAMEFEAAEALTNHGDVHGIRGALEAAITRWDSLANAFEGGNRISAGMMWSQLSATLHTLGARTGGEEGLELLFRAMKSAEKAVQRFTEAQLPAESAVSLGQLGNALKSAGDRLARPDGLALLERAGEAYNAALPIYEQFGMRDQWAAAHSNLGALLRTRGERSEGEEGLNLLAEAVAAYEAALNVYTPQHLPVEWSGIMNNLASIFQRQSERAEGKEQTALCERGIECLKAALTVRTQENWPVLWAESQNNLGGVLGYLGQQSEEQERLTLLALAIDALRAALKVRTMETLPVAWATTQNNLGNALMLSGDGTPGDEGVELLAQAVQAFRSALRVRTRRSMPVQWATTHNNLGNALQAHGDRLPGPEGLVLLGQAAEAYRSALTVLTSEHFSQLRLGVEENLRATLRAAEDRARPDDTAEVGVA